MRERSRARMEETRRHYEEIRSAAGPARSGYESYQRRVYDLTVFLENDFNKASLSALAGDVRSLTDQAAQIVARLDACMDAAESYVRSASVPSASQQEEKPTAAASSSSDSTSDAR
jgi:hypothetical protein